MVQGDAYAQVVTCRERTLPASLLRSLLTRGAKLTVTATLKARNTLGTTTATKAFRIVAAT